MHIVPPRMNLFMFSKIKKFILGGTMFLSALKSRWSERNIDVLFYFLSHDLMTKTYLSELFSKMRNM